METQSNPQVFAAKLKNKIDLLQSSSGGAFTAISNLFLSRGDLVIASHYDISLHQQVFGLIDSTEKRNDARGSKYMKSVPGDIFNMAYEWLKKNQGKSLAFFGLGCQVDGFRKFLEMKGLRERACLVDIICTGGVSPRIWEEYISSIEKSQKKKTELITFKDKVNGWKRPMAIALADGHETSLKQYVDLFNTGCALMPSCYRCSYTTPFRKSDITIGDYWGIEGKIPEFYDRNGVSLILLHSEFGRNVFEDIKPEMDFAETTIEDCLQPRLKEPSRRSEFRDAFWKEYKAKGAPFVVNKYSHIDRKAGRFKNRIRLMLFKFR